MLLWLCVALAQAGPAERAEKLYQKAERVAPDEPFKKLKLLDKALDKDPTHSLARLRRAQLKLQLAAAVAEVDESLMQTLARSAIEELVHIIEHDEGSVVAGIARDELARLQAAAGQENPPLQLAMPEPACPAEAVAAFQRAEQAFAAKDKAAARDHYEVALKGCPDNTVWWTYAGDAHFPDEMEEALWHYQEALNRFPCNWQALRFAGDALMHMDRGREAYDVLTHSVSCNPTYAAAWSQAADLARFYGGEPRWTGPIQLPTSAAAVETWPEAARWRAWLAQREAQPVTDLATAAAAVRAGLTVEGTPEAGIWALLAAADQQEQLHTAILVLMLEPELVDELQTAHAAIDPLVNYVRTALLPVR